MDVESPALEKLAFQMLGGHLRTETSPAGILHYLEVLVAGICHPLRGKKRARAFLRVGGLPALIPHIRGTAASRATSDTRPGDQATSGAIVGTAAEALAALCRLDDATRANISNTTSIILPLVDALRAAPTVGPRCMAAYLLQLLAAAQPKERQGMTEAGVVGLVLVLYNDVWSLSPDACDFVQAVILTNPAAVLVQELLCEGTQAANDLRRAICSPHIDQAFIALLLVQVRHFCSHTTVPWRYHGSWKSLPHQKGERWLTG